MRYLVDLGFNTKQLWVYDEKEDVYIDPPAELLNELDKLSFDKAEEQIHRI